MALAEWWRGAVIDRVEPHGLVLFTENANGIGDLRGSASGLVPTPSPLAVCNLAQSPTACHFAR
jgi:hypothetical protein